MITGAIAAGLGGLNPNKTYLVCMVTDSANITYSFLELTAASSLTVDGSGNISLSPSRSFANAPSRSLVSVAAAANGFQLSSSQDADVSYSCSISTTATISGPAIGYIVLEICATNSATAANWQEISRLTNGQTITLAITLQSVQLFSGILAGFIPAGFYARMRSVNTSGTPGYSYMSGQETLL